MSYPNDKAKDRNAPADAKDASQQKADNYKKNRRRGNGNKKRGQQNERSADRESTSSESATSNSSALNDIAWYTKYNLLADVASRFQFMNRPGDFLGQGGIGNSETVCREIPGIMRIEYQAAIGSSVDNSSPASICAKGIYDNIRDAYSGTLHAEPADIFMYMMHIDQFQAYIAWLKRIYGILNEYTPFNYHMPINIFKAMFPNASGTVSSSMFYDWVAKKNDLVNYINQLVYMCNKYVVPADMAVYDRHRWMNERIYRDSDSVLSQLYVFTPTGFWRVKGVNVEHGTEMHFVPFGTLAGAEPVRTPEQAFEYGLKMYRALADWGDAKTINGYIMRAYEGRWYPPCELMPIDYHTETVFSLEVLLQIHNLRAFPQYIEKDWLQDPDTQAIICQPTGLNYNLNDPIIDIPADIPDQGSIIIATRLNPVIKSVAPNDYRMCCGTEIVTNLYMTWRATSDIGVDNSEFHSVTFAFINNTEDASDRLLYLVERLWTAINYSAFALAPLVRCSYTESGTGREPENSFISYIGELTNPTVVDALVMSKLHLVCQQSEFNIYNARLA